MSKNIVNEAKAEVAVNNKANKVKKTYTLGQIIKSAAIGLVLMAIGGYITLTVNNAINDHIDQTVSAQVKQASK